MPLTIADETLRNAGMSAEELRVEVAAFLFQRDRLTLGQASAVAELSQIEFQRELARRGIPLHYDVEDLEQDVESLRQYGLL